MKRHVVFLLCDEIETEMAPKYGEFDRMFQNIFFPPSPATSLPADKLPDTPADKLPELSSLSFSSYRVFQDQFPTEREIDQSSLVIISGSRWGVYDDFSWLGRLNTLILRFIKKQVPLIGICFGHQAIAHALGGKVVKYSKGWHIGMQPYDIDASAFEKVDSPPQQWIPTMHQDQIISLPEGAKNIAVSDFCQNAGLIYPELKVISFQFHIEYPAAYFQWALGEYIGTLYTQEQGAQALETCRQAEIQKQHGGRFMAKNALEWLKFPLTFST